MKTKHILIVLCLFCTIPAFAQDKLFEKYAEMDNVTSVYISKAMFQMMPAIENVGLNLMNMNGKIESLQLISSERVDQIPQMRKEFTQLINKQHQELMQVRDGKTRVTFHADIKGEQVKNLLMLADTDSSFTVIRLSGNFTLQDVQDITKNINN